MKIKPLEDRVVIMPAEAETKTKSGIFLPEGAAEKPMQGKIVALGPGRCTDEGNCVPLSVTKGDTVIYSRYAGSEIEIKGKKHLIMKESEILGVID